MEGVLNMQIMNRIKQLRVERNLSQQELGDEIGVAQQTISRLELENYLPPTDIVISLAIFFDVSIDYLLGYSECKERAEDLVDLDKISQRQCELIKKYNKLGDMNKKTLDILLDRLIETEIYSDKR